MPDPVSPRARRIWRLKRRFGAPSDPLPTVCRPMFGTAAILLIVAIAAVGAVWLVACSVDFARQGAESAEQLAGATPRSTGAWPA